MYISTADPSRWSELIDPIITVPYIHRPTLYEVRRVYHSEMGAGCLPSTNTPQESQSRRLAIRSLGLDLGTSVAPS